jgi:hypothetical protein
MGLTFKKQPKETGLMGIGYPYSNVDIKWNKKIIGYIYAPTWKTKDNKWGVRFSVKKIDIMEDGNPNCVWRWVHLIQKFDSEELARHFIKEHINQIFEHWNIYDIDKEELVIK